MWLNGIFKRPSQLVMMAIALAMANQVVAEAMYWPKLILADSPHYLIGRFLALDPQLRWTQRSVNGILFTSLRSPARHIFLVEKHNAWPRDANAEVLAMPECKFVTRAAAGTFIRMPGRLP